MRSIDRWTETYRISAFFAQKVLARARRAHAGVSVRAAQAAHSGDARTMQWGAMAVSHLGE